MNSSLVTVEVWKCAGPGINSWSLKRIRVCSALSLSLSLSLPPFSFSQLPVYCRLSHPPQRLALQCLNFPWKRLTSQHPPLQLLNPVFALNLSQDLLSLSPRAWLQDASRCAHNGKENASGASAPVLLLCCYCCCFCLPDKLTKPCPRGRDTSRAGGFACPHSEDKTETETES